MTILRSVADVRAWRRGLGASHVGFVPTMGALHDGHGSLVQKAVADGGPVIVSVFVNPSQFNDPADLARYPRTEELDLKHIQDWGADAAFLPTSEEIYSDGYNFSVHEQKESEILCGRFRPGHFQGVLTVVMKLFQIVQPERAYFGEKDFQQLRLIQNMIRAFHMPVTVRALPTVREADGLAMSSRNVRLSPADRERAPALYRTLSRAPSAAAARAELEKNGFQVEYVEDHWGRRLAAVVLGGVRLIDNVEI